MLPSFGAFTGGHAVKPTPDEAVFVVADTAIFRVPGQGPDTVECLVPSIKNQ
jgi:hypothetical protein